MTGCSGRTEPWACSTQAASVASAARWSLCTRRSSSPPAGVRLTCTVWPSSESSESVRSRSSPATSYAPVLPGRSAAAARASSMYPVAGKTGTPWTRWSLRSGTERVSIRLSQTVALDRSAASRRAPSSGCADRLPAARPAKISAVLRRANVTCCQG